jgi:uncharacterized membrane protein
MEASVEARLTSIENRLLVIERTLGVDLPAPQPQQPRIYPPPPQQQPRIWPPPPQELSPAAGPRPSRPVREPLDLEELLGGRVLAWVGGVAVVLAAVFFLAMAIHNGWIDEPTRVVLAFAGSAALTALGFWLYEAKGRTQAARAAVAAGIASFYASDTAATALYHLVDPAVGLGVAGATGAVATALAVRWRSLEVGGIGLVGALLAPVLVDAGTSTSALVFMTLALCATVGVLLWQRWSWLAVLAYVLSAPQAAGWIFDERHAHLGLALLVTAAFWLLYVVAALGYELRVPTAKLRVASASLLFVNASLTSLAGWLLLDDVGNHQGATAWVIAIAAAHAALGFAVGRGRISGEIARLLVAVGSALGAVGLALALSGPALVAGWSAEAVILAWVGARVGDRRGQFGSLVFLAAAALHTLIFEAPPRALAYGLDSVPQAIVALLLVVVAALVIASLVPELSGALVPAAAVAGVYLGSVLVVDVAGGHSASVQQHAQLALSAFWGALGFGGLVAGLVRDRRPLRLGGLALLGLAVGKVFVVDLAALASLWRVASFLLLGLLLLAGAFAYQRMRKETRPS